MKASAEICAGAHAKVSCIRNHVCLFLLKGECEKTMRSMRFAQPELLEADLCAQFEYRRCALAVRSVTRHAYFSVVSSGLVSFCSSLCNGPF